jgi:hypothetical protein
MDPTKHWKREGGEFKGGTAYGYTCPEVERLMLNLVGLRGYRKPDQRDTIVSFNYDTLIEDALHSLGVPYTYGLPDGLVDYDTSVAVGDRIASAQRNPPEALIRSPVSYAASSEARNTTTGGNIGR